MSLLVNQLLILLWKSWITRLRHWISTIFELLIPLLLAVLIAYIYGSAQRYVGNSYQDTAPTNEDSMNWPPTTPQPHEFELPTINFDGNSMVVQNLLYGPLNEKTRQLIESLKDSIEIKNLRSFPTSEEVDKQIELMVTNNSDHRSSFAVIFDTKALEDNRLIYTIRAIGYEISQSVNRLFPYKPRAGPAPDPHYYYPFVELQFEINNAFLRNTYKEKGQPLKTLSVKAYKYPYPSFKPTTQSFSIQDFIAGAIAVAYVILCPLVVKRITDEKVAKAKEMLKMIGLSDWVFWGSHFISYFMIMAIHSFIFTLLYCVGFYGFPIVEYSNTLLFFTILLIYSAQTVLFCMTLTTVFNRPVLAVVVTVIVWILSYAVPFGVLMPLFHPEINIIGTNKYRILSAFLPNMGLSWAFAIVGQFEILGTGAHWSTLFKETPVYGSMTLGVILFTMLMSCLLYGILIWYVDNVWPFQYGVPKSIFFPFSQSYWCPSKYKSERRESLKDDQVIDTRNFEREPDTRVAIKISNLVKRFGGFGTYRKTAVDNLSLNICENGITVLLGHNGAGKSTTMNMITGIFPPTSGTILVDGYDIQFDTSRARMEYWVVSTGLTSILCLVFIH